MKRVRSYHAVWPCSMWAMAKRLRAIPFGEGSVTGFIIDRAREDQVVGRYVEQVSFLETVRDPRGAEWTYERTTFIETEFICSTAFPELRLIDPPRSAKGFFTALNQALSFEATIEPLKVQLLQWLDNIRKEFEANFRCEAVRLMDVVVSARGSATVELLSDADARTDISIIDPSESGIVERSLIVFSAENGAHRIVLSRDGSMRSSRELTLELGTQLLLALPPRA